MSFSLQKEQHVPEVNATVKLFTHDKSGAQLMSVTNSDENKVLGVTFLPHPGSQTEFHMDMDATMVKRCSEDFKKT